MKVVVVPRELSVAQRGDHVSPPFSRRVTRKAPAGLTGSGVSVAVLAARQREPDDENQQAERDAGLEQQPSHDVDLSFPDVPSPDISPDRGMMAGKTRGDCASRAKPIAEPIGQTRGRKDAAYRPKAPAKASGTKWISA
jgi:hypothetical protein